MKRLLKSAENMYLYEAVSPIMVNFGDEDYWKVETLSLKDEKEFESTIRDAVDESMNEIGPRGLAEYLNEPLNSKINSIIVTVRNCEAVTKIVSNEELSDSDLNKLKNYIAGQFSDGWGGGFEQHPLDEWQERDEYDEDDDEEQYTVTMSASFWDNKDWSITITKK